MSFRDNARIKAEAAAQCDRPAGVLPTIPAWRSTRSTARRESIRRAGPGRTRISAAPWRRSKSKLLRTRRDGAGAAQGAFRLGAVRRLAGRPCRGFRGAGRRHAGLAAARRQGLRLRSDVPARRPHAHLRRNVERRKTRLAAARQRPVASRARLREARGGVPWPMSETGSFRRLHPLAVLPVEMSLLRLQQPRAPRADRRAALRARLSRPRSRRPRRAFRTAPFRRSSSAAARRR